MHIYTVLSEPHDQRIDTCAFTQSYQSRYFHLKKNSVSPDEKPQNMVPQKGMCLILEIIN